MSIKPLFDNTEERPTSDEGPDQSERTIQSPDQPSHPRNRDGRNTPDGGATSYEKNSPDEFSSRVPDPLERRDAEQLGAEDRERGYIFPDNPGERSGPDKRLDEDESGL